MTWRDVFSRQLFLAPNGLSFLRGIVGALLPIFILSHSPKFHWIAAALFIFGALTDYWDGLIARRHNLASDIGKIVDPTMDKILILAPAVAFAHLGFFSIGWIVPIVVREILITFCRIGWLLEGKAIGAEKLGKLKLVFQVILVGAALLYLISLDHEWLHFASAFARLLMTICLYAALGLTLVSGISFAYSNRIYFGDPVFMRFVSALGVGLIPKAPGTWGSLFGVMLVLLLSWSLPLYLALFSALLWIGFWSVSKINLAQDKDPSFVVVDEALGIFVTFFAIPLGPLAIVAGFILFRMFDILKPFPLRRLERLPGFWGILCDDLGAGLYAWLALKLFFR